MFANTRSLSIVSILIVLLASPVRGKAPEFDDLDKNLRSRVDRIARQKKSVPLSRESVDFGGNIVAWVLAQTALTPKEERKRSDELLQVILEDTPKAKLPKPVAKLWDRLVEHIPNFMKPKPFRFELTAVKDEQPRIRALGGGRVIISTGLLDTFPLGTEPGREALGFLLARELGHIGYEHCRRGWQLEALKKAALRKLTLIIPLPRLERSLETGIRTSGRLIYFLYSREQEYEADYFGWQLCRNAGFSTEGTLDGMRYLVLVRYPEIVTDKTFRAKDVPLPSVLGYYLSTDPEPLTRLSRLLSERDGRVPRSKKFGLFRFDRDSGKFLQCKKREIPKNKRSIVLIHGLRGGNNSFDDLVEFLDNESKFDRHEILLFRYPNNESLARCAGFLSKEMKRAVADPERASFVAYSAGGLIFRYYAERLEGAFDKVVILGTPHQGSSLTELKFFLDMAYFVKDAQLGVVSALAKTLPEGRGAVVHDLHPDSLFLRHLGSNKALAKRYHIIYGEYFGSFRRFAVRSLTSVVKRSLEEALDRIDSDFGRKQAEHVLRQFVIPREVLYGDLVVSSRSARLPGAGKTIGTRLHHIDLKKDHVVHLMIRKTLSKK